jgi:hypothetical protein
MWFIKTLLHTWLIIGMYELTQWALTKWEER